MRTNADLTLYNKRIVAGQEVFRRTQLRGVMWENRKGRNALAVGVIAADQATIYIPMSLPGHLEPKAWRAGLDESGGEEAETWTLQTGDILVKGLVEDELGESFTPSKLKALYDDVLAITTVDRMDMGSETMQHWQVGAK